MDDAAVSQLDTGAEAEAELVLQIERVVAVSARLAVIECVEDAICEAAADAA